jgi:hypothetical protein
MNQTIGGRGIRSAPPVFAPAACAMKPAAAGDAMVKRREQHEARRGRGTNTHEHDVNIGGLSI